MNSSTSTAFSRDQLLSQMATEAIEDFERLLRIMGKDSMTVDDFCVYLDSLGFEGDSVDVFFGLIGVKASSSGPLLTADTLRELYSSPTYTACESSEATGRDLMTFIKNLFVQADKDGSGYLDADEIEEFVGALIADKDGPAPNGPFFELEEEEKKAGKESELRASYSSCSSYSELFQNDEKMERSVSEILSRCGDTGVGLEEFASVLLRYPLEKTPEVEADGFDSSTLDPFHATPEQFAKAVEDYVLRHTALHHHLLDTISKGVHGEHTVEIVFHFLGAYRFFTANFCNYLRGCIEKMPQEHMVEILLENEAEENGHYDQDDIEMMTRLGLEPQSLKGVNHRDLFLQCILNLKRAAGIVLEQTSTQGKRRQRKIYRPNGRPLLVDIPSNCTDASLGLNKETPADARKKASGNSNDEGSGSSSQCGPKESPDKQKFGTSTDDQLKAVASKLVEAFDAACLDKETSSAQSAIAAMYFGSELLVGSLYSQISKYLMLDPRLSTQDLAFFALHIDLDVEHAQKMREIVIELVDTREQREKMFKAVQRIMDARVSFYDDFIQCFFPPTGHGGIHSGALYNKQCGNWVRKKASCLSDFTGRPVIFDMCAPHIEGAHVLDVGCGEGYAARKFMMMGASAVTGLDISENMVAKAKENALSPNENFLVGDAAHLTHVIEVNPTTVGITPGASTEVGCFDLAVGIFVFNYTSINDMNLIVQQVYKVLKPGGHFVFSVPHPFMLHAHEEGNSTFGFAKGDATPSSYFSLRDRKFSGTIKTLDGRVLNVKMCFKAISDYIEAVTGAGFDITYIHEARVLPEHVQEHPEFFESVKDSPLHIVFKVSKPAIAQDKQTPLQCMPKKIRWNPYQYQNVEATLVRTIPANAKAALTKIVDRLVADGVTAENYETSSADKTELGAVATFAFDLKNLIKQDTGAVLVRGLDFGTERSSKLAYYILSSMVGRVDESARGRLFDVRDAKLSTAVDNVLFSVSNTEATWHTDGASMNRSYECASLLCLRPAACGGALKISNAVNAFENLQGSLPKFLLYELLRPLPRDILENGNGKGRLGDTLLDVSRCPGLLERRIRNNSYPIYVNNDDTMRFRYMRYWIETGHQKAGLELSQLLRVSMDLLDKALDKAQLWEARMQPGEAIYCNNLLIAHARNAFENVAGVEPRHKVRAWLQL